MKKKIFLSLVCAASIAIIPVASSRSSAIIANSKNATRNQHISRTYLTGEFNDYTGDSSVETLMNGNTDNGVTIVEETEPNTTSSAPESTTENSTESEVEKQTEPEVKAITAEHLVATPYSVSCIEVDWDEDTNSDREYYIDVSTDAGYVENISYVFSDSSHCFITGLRENSKYTITVTPQETEYDTNVNLVPAVVECNTEAVTVIEEFPYEVGDTCCFAGEVASGLNAYPSSDAISGSYIDPITGTSIRRFDNGDYACAMGLFYGECNDRFLVTLENGTQFTVRICDSKGWASDADMDSDGDGVADCEGDGVADGRFHWFGYGAKKCVIEFIFDSNGNLPSYVWNSGSWGGTNWNGLNLTANIESIKKINY